MFLSSKKCFIFFTIGSSGFSGSKWTVGSTPSVFSGLLSSSSDILQIKGIDNVVDSVSLDVLIDKGYLTRAGKRSNFAIQRARSEYGIDLRRAIKEKKEEQNILLASK